MSKTKKKKAKAKTYKRNPQVKSSSRRSSKRSHNPVYKARRRRSRNPQFAGFTAGTVMKLGAGALAGSLGTRGLTSVVLGSKNTGAKGIAGNLVAAALLTYAASKVDKDIAAGVAGGSAAAIALRIWEVYVTKVLSDGTGVTHTPDHAADAQSSTDGTPKLGDVAFSSNGLGFYQNYTYPLPQAGAVTSAPAIPGGGQALPRPAFGPRAAA